ncbi:beta-lactamase-like protein [Multifurca ochricompacta]|uniref:Beta-lactamase-like protein n=1 Tax=Multifurca ochricompacta TaxID=376703 RepID=A0AAD4M547_9AGAM|nr:beta-lactamase-like protein [Multifurca ochricompacta]
MPDELSLQLPPFNGSIVRVSILYAGRMEIPTAMMLQPQIPGHDIVDAPIYSFLVENDKVGKKLMYDLGMMKDWEERQAPPIRNQMQSANVTVDIPSDVVDILKSASVPLSSINSILWSHHHADHTGDPSLFPPTTSIIVGPGFKSNRQTYPGYPDNPDAHTVQDAFEGRDLIELDFDASPLKVCGLRAIDWFEDDSFYILEALGHTSDHIMALARTSEDRFLLLAGDAAHHVGEFRPTPLLPLPEFIRPSPFGAPRSVIACPGSIFEQIHPCSHSHDSGSFRTTPFYEPLSVINSDPATARVTLEALKVFDASPDVLVILAHDPSLRDILEFYPEGDLTGWERQDGQPNSKEAGTWRFLRDFGTKDIQELVKAQQKTE